MIDVHIPRFGTDATLSAKEGGAADERTGSAELLLQQVERILHSKELRGSEVLRRLLSFLAEKSMSGEADELKEYIVAIEGLGRPATYDPRHNSAVRIQVGRLRQKLTDYYRGEGLEDAVLIEIPKGRFKLTCKARGGTAPAEDQFWTAAEQPRLENTTPISVGKPERRVRLNVAASITVGILLILAVIVTYRTWHRVPTKAVAATPSIDVNADPNWNADMAELWHPFIAATRPTIVAIEDPLFVELDGKKGVYFRDKTLNSWHDVTTSPSVEALRSALNKHDIAPSRYYTAFGEVDSSFLLGRTLGRVKNLTVVKTSDLSMRSLADNNVVFVGIENIYFTDQIRAAPLEAPFQPVQDGIRNVHPEPGEQAMFLDQFSTEPNEEGIAYALVTHVPGPMGDNDVESFTCNRSAGYVAAVKAFTDPIFAHSLVARLKEVSGGQMPRYYQVLLKVKFTAEVPTEITYVLAREIRFSSR